MKIGSLDISNQVMIIAEIGNNHEGDFDLACCMIHEAAKCGVDAVKFQTFRAEWLVGTSNAKRYQQLKGYELSFEQFEALAQEANKAGILFLSTPFDLECACFLNPIVPAFKIASGDNTFYPLLDTVAGFGKPILLSTGMMNHEDLLRVKDFLQIRSTSYGHDLQLAVLHCVGAYPVPRQQANLNAIMTLRNHLNCTVGYSDHVEGIEAAVLSVAAGARIIEKHFTLDKHYSNFRDHQLSADPADMACLVQRIRDTELYLGHEDKTIQPSEKENASMLRRSIVSRTHLPCGHVLQHSDLAWVRPGTGLPPGQEKTLVGKKLIKDIPAGHCLSLSDMD